MRRTHGKTSRLLTRYGLPPQQQVDLSSPLGLIQFYSQLMQGPRQVVNRGDTIAMVYLEGTIVGGSMPISPCLLYTSPSPRDQRGWRLAGWW